MKSLHIIAGLLALVSGAVALAVLKGGRVHRRSGTIFVYAMLFMASSGALMAVLKMQRVNTMAGVLTMMAVMAAAGDMRMMARGLRVRFSPRYRTA